MTLVEFLYPIRTGKQREIVLAILYYYKRFKEADGMTAAEVRTALTSAKVPKAKTMNVSSIINNAAPYVHSARSNEDGAFVWELTDTGEKHIREVLDLPSTQPEVEQDVATLKKLADEISDDTIKGFIEEAILALGANALRAAIVFLWSGAIRTLHEEALAQGAPAVNAAIKKHDPKAREVKRIEDFAWIKDRTFLDACPDLGILDKGQKDALIDALGLRNRCGHPTEYRPGIHKARAFIEDVVGIVFGSA